eukprot:GSMAST32.ASY1.ANO1.1701.1 assembled CDS
MDYSLLVGLDEENNNLVVGIIDYMRCYDVIKFVESHVVVAKHMPTIVAPPKYKRRFVNAMNRYFMAVPGNDDNE